MQDYAYYSEFSELDFYILGSEENFVESTVTITNKELFKGEIPVSYGCYDAAMGTTSYSFLCSADFLEKDKCPSHFGVVKLRYPVKSPLFRENILKWLKIICFKCGRLIVNKDVTAASSRILLEYVKLAKGVVKCPWPDCEAEHPNVYKDKMKQNVFYAEYKSGRTVKRVELLNNQIKDILDRISNETVEQLHKPVKSHPRNFIIEYMRAPPNAIRPDIRRVGGSRSNNNDITALLKNIVEINETLPQEIPNPEEISKDVHEMYFNLDMTYHELVKGSTSANNQLRLATSSNKAPNSIVNRLNKKTGRIRRNLMGKRTSYMIRSVLSGDPTLRIDEIGMPLNLARSLQIPETVRSYNKQKLTIYFMNKRELYPGCSGILMQATKKFHRIEHLDPNYQLQEGDVVMRDIIEGDFIGFNRQPSLLFGNISSHKVRIMYEGKTLRINPSSCSVYNADFDGDCGNGLIAQNIQSRNELQRMSWIGNWFISYQNSSPYFGCFQDSLIGSAELTRSEIRFDKYHAMAVFGGADMDELNFTEEIYTGRDIVSQFLPKINYPKKKSKIYLPQYAPFIDYDPDELYVQINRGKLISGTLDKSTVGQQVMGSIFQVINNEMGTELAIRTLYNFHQITNRFFLWNGFTVGIADIVINDEAIAEIKEKTQSMIDEANDFTDKINRRELVAPLGVTMADYYEQTQLMALEPADNFVTPILNAINFKDNKMARLIFTGSKGNESNLININGSYGQITINGKRPPRNFSWGRTSPYYLRYDTNPESLGFINSSYREGIKSEVFPFAAGDARYSSIANALSTSVSGAQNRNNVKNLETIITNNLRQSAKNDNIVQLLYADSGVDPRKTEQVKFLTATISDEEMEKQYHTLPTMLHQKFQKSDSVKELLDSEFDQLVKDRQQFRSIFLWAENNNIGNYLFDNSMQMPINPYKVIEDVLYNYEDQMAKFSVSQKILDPTAAIKSVNDFCDSVGYAYYNAICEDRKMPIPEHIQQAVTLLRILIRTYLCTSNMLRRGINNIHLDIIISKLKIIFKNSLIQYGVAVGILAAQNLSEPITQYVLDSRHRSGTGIGTSFNVVERIKEILGGRTRDKMKVVSMSIMVKPEYYYDKLKVQEIANYIEMMDFERFIYSEQIFFEEYGDPVHPDYVHEKKMIKDFERTNLGMMRNAALSKWVIRYELNREEMLINSMKLETIITKLKLKYPQMHIVYTPESSENIILRCYIAHSMIKPGAQGFSESVITDLVKKINSTVIRGIKGINYAKVTDFAKTELQTDGSLKSVKIYGIVTNGSNLEEVLENPYVDPYYTQTNDIKEFEETYGIEATREKIIREIRSVMKSDKVTKEQTSIYADEICYSGAYTSIQRTGLQIRESSNVTLRLSYQSPIQVIENAAVNGTVDKIGGISGPLIVGQVPNVGTTYNNVALDEDFVKSYYNSLNKSIDDEL